MNPSCKECKFGHDTKPNGQRLTPRIVWCTQRGIQIASNRQMSCFKPMRGRALGHCSDCKRARITKPSGKSTQLGYVWCEKKRSEINKQRSMECFEKP
ncbi:hypothetical protein EP227_05530 [bacterium]|nr:MAG: hypothetical protein EP227_05530 [bacterium]